MSRRFYCCKVRAPSRRSLVVRFLRNDVVPHRETRETPAALKVFVHPPKETFATWGNSGIEPDKGKGISSPGTYEASLMWPPNDGERQWNTMSDWTCR